MVDYRGQAVSALNRLHLTADLPTMVIWGDQDRIIPVEHGYAVHRPPAREAGWRCSQASATSLTSNGPVKWSI